MMSRLQAVSLLPLALFSCLLLYSARIQSSSSSLSRQACRMAYMSPSYVHITSLNSSITRLADKYKLFLYREVGWDGDQTVRADCSSFLPSLKGLKKLMTTCRCGWAM
jgi:hypothetical protein